MSNVSLSYKGKNYTLGFNRKTASALEAQGFNIDALTAQPSVMIPMLFYGAFAMNHTGMKRRDVDEIFENLTGKMELINILAESYADTVSTLMEDAPESEGNATWAVQ